MLMVMVMMCNVYVGESRVLGSLRLFSDECFVSEIKWNATQSLICIYFA